MLSAGSSHLVLGRLGRTQSRSRPLKYPWYWGLNAVIGFTVISSYFAKKHLFFCEILLWRLSTVYRYVCIPYELTYHSPLDNFKWIFLSFKDLLLRKYAFLLNFFYQIIPIEIKDILFYFPTKKVYLLLNSFQYKVSSDKSHSKGTPDYYHYDKSPVSKIWFQWISQFSSKFSPQMI